MPSEPAFKSMHFCQQAGVFQKMHNYYTDLQLRRSHISSLGEKDEKALNVTPIDSL